MGILNATVQSLAESLRMGQRVQIIKVKSHIGIKGNEEADRLAHDACKSMNCHQVVLDGLPIREHIHWPVQKQPEVPEVERPQDRPDNVGASLTNQHLDAETVTIPAPQGTPAPCEEDDFMPDHQVNDLRKGMKALIRPLMATGYATQTIYTEAWKATNKYAIGDLSNHFWKAATMPVITQTLKYRFGQLWNMKLAYMRRRPYLPGFPMPRSDRCPHCQLPDSGGHILGGCQHRVMKSLYISRHDEAMRQVLKAISKGSHGSYLKIADIGRDELTSDLGIASKRIPDWLVTDDTLRQCDLPPDRRHVLRPDILLIEATHAEQTLYTTHGEHPVLSESFWDPTMQATPGNHAHQPTTRPQTRRRKVWLLEGGYTSDTRHLDKIAEKKQQHETLLKAMELQGFDTRLLILTFGVGGTIYTRTQDALQGVGVSPTDMIKLLKAIHLHSVACLHNIVVQRRQLDSEILKHQTPRPP